MADFYGIDWPTLILANTAETPHIIDASYPGREPRVYSDTAPTVTNYGSGGNKMPMVIANAIDANYSKGWSPNGHQSQQRIYKIEGRIRKLTPLECERLQGFPDGWTDEGVNGAISNTQRYKVCGNAVTVNVVQAIVERLAA